MGVVAVMGTGEKEKASLGGLNWRSVFAVFGKSRGIVTSVVLCLFEEMVVHMACSCALFMMG